MISCLTPDLLRKRASGKWIDFADDILPSNPAEMDFAIAAPILKALQETIDHQRFGYASQGDSGPVAKLKASFRARMKAKFDWDVEAGHILPVTNLVQAVASLIVAFSEEGEGVSLQLPAYPMFLEAIRQTGRQAKANDMLRLDGRYALDIDALEAQLTPEVKILLLCHPHNPTGRVFSKEELEPLARLVKERALLVISDEIHCDILFDGRSHTPFAKMFPELCEQTVTLQSASKSFNIPGLGCALMIFGSYSVKDRFSGKVPPMLLGHPGISGIVGTTAAWDEGEPWFADLMVQLQANRDLMARRFADELPEVELIKPEATYLAWADFSRCDLPTMPFEFLRDKARVVGGNGANFGPGYEQHVRFNFATSAAILNEKIDRIIRALRSNSKES
nr:aminotransferase class I/II-fold pyridoxal phosphate-dependent enzyme [uncultured Cohaesibacter sp.]